MTGEAWYRTHAEHLWAIAYRMTGSAADADDVVQDTFERALSTPTLRHDLPLRPWLVRVALHASIDVLRRRRRAGYRGPWLPEPIDTAGAHSEGASPAARYDLLESVSFAFLLALEALSPRARAVLLLRDVFDYPVREVAALLSMSEGHTKVTHHRARRLLSTYDRRPVVPTRALQERTREALARLMFHLAARDLAGIEALLADEVRSLTDANGRFTAARLPVVGRHKVALFWSRLAPSQAASIELRMINGLPALLTELRGQKPHVAPRSLLLLRLDGQGMDQGSILELHLLAAPDKLQRLLARPAAPS
jgi:RNA polymerase sigma factor (sigma-70 family)